MPEGPEIRRAADQLEKAIQNQPLTAIWFKFAALKSFEAKLLKSRVTQIETRGKAMLTHFSCGLTIYSHNQLYGLWHVATAKAAPLARDLRLSLQTRTKRIDLYSASDISVWETTKVEHHPFLQKLGPDALTPNITWTDIVQRMNLSAFAGKSLQTLLLDQRFVAGIGNYLRTEILFDARLMPQHKPKQLNQGQQQQLAQAILRIVKRSYRSAGVTNEAALTGAIETNGIQFEGYRFAVFESLAGMGRRLYVCRHCQS
jgi:endonuclease VIII